MDYSEVIRLLAGSSSAGRPVYEELRAEPLGASRYRIRQSPGLVLGIAADDVVSIDADGRFEVLQRGNNLCIQLFSRGEIDALEGVATPALRALGGRLDGKSAKELVYTVPVTAGFKALEAVLNALGDRFDDYQWFYGNVYDPKDGETPLNWWNDSATE